MIDLSRLWVTEWVAGVFFTYLTLLAVQRTLPVRHQLRVLAVGFDRVVDRVPSGVSNDAIMRPRAGRERTRMKRMRWAWIWTFT